MTIMTYTVFCVVMLFLVACFISSRLLASGLQALFTKTMASLAMVLGAILAVSHGYSFWFLLIVAGVVCGMLGDIFIELKKLYPQDDFSHFNMGVAVFGLGHLMYIFALIRMLPSYYHCWPDALIAGGASIAFSVLLIFVLSKPLKLNFGKCKWQSFVYCTILTFVAVFSVLLYFKTNRISVLLPIGFIAFLLSDLVLSLQFFGDKKYENAPLLVIANHVLYYGAQVLIIGSLY